MTATFDVLGLGCAAVDDLLYVDAYPPPDRKVRVRRRERQCGGLTATALVAAARLGGRCAYAGALGEDEDSRFVIDCFRREGIDTGHLVRRPEARPIRSTIVVDETHRTRTIWRRNCKWKCRSTPPSTKSCTKAFRYGRRCRNFSRAN